MTVTIGWWAIPAAITLAVIVCGLLPRAAPRGYTSVGDSIVGALFLLLGIIISLIAWLIWALLS